MREPHSITTFPASRLGTVDLGRIARDRHHVAGLLEVDVTLARRRLRETARSGGRVSFAAWMIHVIALALAADGEVNARRLGRRRKVRFTGATISVAVERKADGVLAPVPLVVRNADTLSLEEITMMLREAAAPAGKNTYAVNAGVAGRTQGLFFFLPGWLRRTLLRWFMRNPFRAHRIMGSAVFTATGMTGNAPAWILPKSYHPLCFALGSIVEKPWAVAGRVEIRQIAHLTLLADHDVIDGAPLARFVRRLCSALQKAEGL